jgi:hypothetical protein
MSKDVQQCRGSTVRTSTRNNRTTSPPSRKANAHATLPSRAGQTRPRSSYCSGLIKPWLKPSTRASLRTRSMTGGSCSRARKTRTRSQSSRRPWVHAYFLRPNTRAAGVVILPGPLVQHRGSGARTDVRVTRVVPVPPAAWKKRNVLVPADQVGWDAQPPRLVSVDWGRSSRPVELHHRHRVARGDDPPPAPTERSVRISRTTLVGR